MARVHESFGSQALPKELENIWLENTSQYDPYEDETHYKQSFPQLAEELQPMSEVGDHYIGAEILLPRGDEMARVHAMAFSHDVNGNIMGRAHTNPILDTRMYQVEFAGIEVKDLTSNIIHESMYAKHEADGNEYLG